MTSLQNSPQENREGTRRPLSGITDDEAIVLFSIADPTGWETTEDYPIIRVDRKWEQVAVYQEKVLGDEFSCGMVLGYGDLLFPYHDFIQEDFIRALSYLVTCGFHVPAFHGKETND